MTMLAEVTTPQNPHVDTHLSGTCNAAVSKYRYI